jgi:hypothetical protein
MDEPELKAALEFEPITTVKLENDPLLAPTTTDVLAPGPRLEDDPSTTDVLHPSATVTPVPIATL